MSSPMRRRLVAACLSPLVAAILPAAPAGAEEVTPRPSTGSLTFTGHGFGHGRGMSQYGAYGAATKGLSYSAILAFYYPGTVRSQIPDDTIRVSISADNDGDTIVEPSPGLRVQGAGNAVPLPAGAAYTRWRVVAGSGSLTLQYRDAAGVWKPYTLNFAAGTDLTFTSSGGTVTVVLPSGNRQELRGAVRAVLTGGTVRTVLYSSMESYLRGVVPNEMPASWHAQALSAQSVAARTYAAAYRQRQQAVGSWYDICDTVSCQVFSGVAQTGSGPRVPKEDGRTDAAIAATSGVVLRTSTSGPLVNAEFSSSNGGWTAAGPVPYQVSKPDPYDEVIPGSPHDWTLSVPLGSLDNAFGIGTFRRLVVLKRDGKGDMGGRVLQARLDGDTRSVTVTGAQIRAQLGLRSDWFSLPTSAAGTFDWNGDGTADVMMRDQQGLLRYYAGNGKTFASWTAIGHGWAGMVDIVAAGDFDGAGGPDIIGRLGDGGVYLYGSDGKGNWTTQKQIGRGWTDYRALVSPGDWNGDGRADLLAIRSSTGELVLSGGQIGGGLGGVARIGTGWGNMVTLITAGDVSNDGRADLLAIDRQGDLWLYSGDGAGSFSGQRKVGHGWSGMQQVWSVGDVNGDDRPDLLAITSDGTLMLYAGNAGLGWDSRTLGAGWSGLTPVR
ncbi:MAG: SpoIID/LytB domain-containing protein [Dermatophilaceae bacterium]